MSFFDLHAHDEFSAFDGFSKAVEKVEIAVSLGYNALGLTNHGNTSGLVQHYFACKEADIKPILGVEMYFQPKLDKEKKRYHLNLFAKDLEGYANMNKLVTIGERQKYYNPIITYKDLREHSKGVICTSACIAGYAPMLIAQNKKKIAYKSLQKFKEIFGDDFYIEIQPYELGGDIDQKEVNEVLMKMAKKLDIKCILTSDSHYGLKKDWDTYLKMHEIAGSNYDIEATYKERYMPSEKEIVDRYVSMHGSKKTAQKMNQSLQEIYEKVDGDILDKLEMTLPEYETGTNSHKVLIKKIKDGLKSKGKFDKAHINRCKQELEVIKHHGFEDYFLIVADYVNWAKEQGIVVGPGRGSVCNCEIAYALGITGVDSLKYGLDFRRFLRLDKAKLPDIDLDFETSRRIEVIDYLMEKYEGKVARICSYGLYKVDNLVNDLVKVCDAESYKSEIKTLVKKYVDDDGTNIEGLRKDKETRHFNRNFDNIIKHFSKLYKKMRFIGTHAAGVAIVSDELEAYSALRIVDKTEYTSYDLADLDKINVVKFDILGLKTMESIGDLRRLTGNGEMDENMVDDPAINEAFGKGETDGIFQFEKDTARNILRSIESDCFEDVVAASSMNRPGPLSLKTPEHYAENKKLAKDGELKKDMFYEYTKETYGTLVYQEQLQAVCINIGNMSWADSDKVMKLMKNAIASMGELEEINREKQEMLEKFVKGAKENGFKEKEAREFFSKILVYAFNKGHSVGYSLISVEEMFYKLNYPMEFWFVKMKYADDRLIYKFMTKAVQEGIVIMLPHVNQTCEYTIAEIDGNRCIQQGYGSVKNVGAKAAKAIQEEKDKNGEFTSVDDFLDRIHENKRIVNKRVIDALTNAGALEFDKDIYYERCSKFNVSLYSRR